MNAYELADALAVESSQMEYGYVVDDWELLDKSAQMLRQQADRIAELEKQIKPLSNDEILEMTIWNKNLYELYVEMEKEDMIAFARAIEKRHGIK